MQEAQAKYRKLVLLLLPFIGAMIAGQALMKQEWNVSRVGLFLFFVVFFCVRLTMWIREK